MTQHTSISAAGIEETLNEHEAYIQLLNQVVQECKSKQAIHLSESSRYQQLLRYGTACSIQTSILLEAFTILLEDPELRSHFPYDKNFLCIARRITKEIAHQK